MNSNMPKISVIIPTYNRADIVKKAIKSVLEQNFSDLELIVIDDHSEDNTEEVVMSFRDSRLKQIRQKKRQGAPAARNAGIKIARGEFIGLLDDDDKWLPNKLKYQIEKFKIVSNKIGLIYCAAQTVNSKTNKIISSTLPDLKGNILKDLLRSNAISSATPLIRKKCFDAVGLYDETLTGCQDWDMWVRIAEKFEIDFIEEILAQYFIHGEQMSANIEARIVSRTTFLKKHRKLYLKLDIDAYIDQLNHLGILCLIAYDNKKACQIFRKSIKTKPYQKNGYKHLFFSLIAPSLYRSNLKLVKLKEAGEVVFY